MELSAAEQGEFDRRLGEIDQRVGTFGLKGVADFERVVFSAMSAKLQIDNGGLRRFFEFSMPLSDARRAFAELGLSELEATCGRILRAAFPEGEPANHKSRGPMLEAAWSPELAKYQDEIWDQKVASIEVAALAYLRRHDRADD